MAHLLQVNEALHAVFNAHYLPAILLDGGKSGPVGKHTITEPWHTLG